MHIIRAFTQFQVRKIPEKYILKRYTRDAREEVMWDSMMVCGSVHK